MFAIGLRFATVCARVTLDKCAGDTGKKLVLWMRRERGKCCGTQFENIWWKSRFIKTVISLLLTGE